MRFAKYEGAGNDFILLDLRNGGATPQSAEIARLCDRHFGIGADGLMTLAASAVSGCDCSMRYYNADGSPGEMCGNGGRCFALFAHHPVSYTHLDVYKRQIQSSRQADRHRGKGCWS